jgi:hypothetical protein
MNKGRSHNQVFSGQIQVKRLDYFKILKILLGDQCYRNIININFIFLDQIQKQVERTLKYIQLDSIIRGFVVQDKMYSPLFKFKF